MQATMTIDDAGRVTSPIVARRPGDGAELTFELPDLHVRLGPTGGARLFSYCTA